jgi:hypothetical protein
MQNIPAIRTQNHENIINPCNFLGNIIGSTLSCAAVTTKIALTPIVATCGGIYMISGIICIYRNVVMDICISKHVCVYMYVCISVHIFLQRAGESI